MEISELLAFSVKNKASDLHLSAGLPPMIRVHGDMRRINVPPLNNQGSARHGVRHHERQAAQALRSSLRRTSPSSCPASPASGSTPSTRNRGAGAVFRTIPSRVLTLEQLEAPVFKDIADTPRGSWWSPARPARANRPRWRR
jgi:twitching motility protein PilT